MFCTRRVPGARGRYEQVTHVVVAAVPVWCKKVSRQQQVLIFTNTDTHPHRESETLLIHRAGGDILKPYLPQALAA